LCSTKPTWNTFGLKSDLHSRNQNLTPLAAAQSSIIWRTTQHSVPLLLINIYNCFIIWNSVMFNLNCTCHSEVQSTFSQCVGFNADSPIRKKCHGLRMLLDSLLSKATTWTNTHCHIMFRDNLCIVIYYWAVAYPGILFGGYSTISVEDRRQRTGIWGR